MRWVLALLGEKVVLVFRYGGCSVTSGWTLHLDLSVVQTSWISFRAVQSQSKREYQPIAPKKQNRSMLLKANRVPSLARNLYCISMVYKRTAENHPSITTSSPTRTVTDSLRHVTRLLFFPLLPTHLFRRQ